MPLLWTFCNCIFFYFFAVGAAAIFAIVGGQVNDRLGRKPSTLIASVVFAFGAILLAAAQNTAMLIVGRFILGIGIGKINHCHFLVFTYFLQISITDVNEYLYSSLTLGCRNNIDAQ